MRAATHSGMQAETVRLGAQACGDYGAPNIHAELRENGTRVGFCQLFRRRSLRLRAVEQGQAPHLAAIALIVVTGGGMDGAAIVPGYDISGLPAPFHRVFRPGDRGQQTAEYLNAFVLGAFQIANVQYVRRDVLAFW